MVSDSRVRRQVLAGSRQGEIRFERRARCLSIVCVHGGNLNKNRRRGSRVRISQRAVSVGVYSHAFNSTPTHFSPGRKCSGTPTNVPGRRRMMANGQEWRRIIFPYVYTKRRRSSERRRIAGDYFLMEARGFEPRSEKRSTTASTCVFH